jgi:lipopolysaccharide biosynthesis protein
MKQIPINHFIFFHFHNFDGHQGLIHNHHQKQYSKGKMKKRNRRKKKTIPQGGNNYRELSALQAACRVLTDLDLVGNLHHCATNAAGNSESPIHRHRMRRLVIC